MSNLNLDSQPYSTNTLKTKEIKPLNAFINSSIIKDKDINYLYELFSNKNFVSFSLVYKLTRDNEKSFHNLCDKIGPTLSIFKIRRSYNTDSYNRFGGFTSLNWDCSKQSKKDESAFIFSLTKRKVFKAKKPFYSIYCSIIYGPSFGYEGLYSGLWTKGKFGGYNPCDTFEDKERECTCGLKEFIIEELEVYKVSFEDIK